ncbi:hypothetical protein TNCV_2058681 [Trichonephila clavipes]|nr:hypothetical protein TNCV_2058681 [Trichonephila clavipes]
MHRIEDLRRYSLSFRWYPNIEREEDDHSLLMNGAVPAIMCHYRNKWQPFKETAAPFAADNDPHPLSVSL